jgi:hypothetical protein
MAEKGGLSMSYRHKLLGLTLSLSLTWGAGVGLAHITPPVVLISERDAVLAMTGGAKKFFVREVRLSQEEREAIQRQWGWRPEEERYRFYIGREEAGQLIAAVIFLTDFTIHGPVRVATALGPDGKVRDASVIELTEETYPWLKPLIDQGFTHDYAGRGSQGSFGLSERWARAGLDSMPQFYAQVVAGLIQRAAILFDVTVLKRGEKT